MQTTLLSDVRRLLLNLNGQQSAPSSMSSMANGSIYSKTPNKPTTSGNLKANSKFDWGNTGKTQEIPVADNVDDLGETSAVINGIRDADDGAMYDHVSHSAIIFAKKITDN